MKNTNIAGPDYFHKVVDCQWACPAHTPVPEYIRLIAEGRYSDAYMINWHSNVFPGILGRTCDRPCEPACRRVRVEKEPVAICRLKSVAADYKDDITARLPKPAAHKNGKRDCARRRRAGLAHRRPRPRPARLSGDGIRQDPKAGGMIRTQIPKFRLPDQVIDEECGYILGLGVDFQRRQAYRQHEGAARRRLGRDLRRLRRAARARPRHSRPQGSGEKHPYRHRLAVNSVSFGHTTKIGKRVIVLGGGNTAMDCCRSSRRLGGEEVQVVVRSGFEEMKASPWEKEDAMHEGIPIHNFLVPKEFTHDNGKLTGITFEKVRAEYDAKGRRKLVPAGEPPQHFPCDDVLVAVGQENAFPWIERDAGIEFNDWGLPKLDAKTFQSTNPKVFFGGDSAFGPKNIIWAVAHGHEAAVSIDKMLNGEDMADRPMPAVELISQKMGIHEWSYSNEIANDNRYRVPLRDKVIALKDIKAEVELGFDQQLALAEAGRCLNCDVQTVFTASLCIECDACVDICPMDCITFTVNGEEAELRARLEAPSTNLTQDLYVQDGLKTGRVMVKDEDVCLHCGLCAERCPTGAWDMQKFLLDMTYAGPSCRPSRRSAA